MSGDNIRNSSVVRRLQRFVDEYDSQRAAAKALGNKNYQSSISKALAGERMPSKAVRKALDEYETRHRMEQPEPADAPPDSQDTVLFSVIMRLARDTKNTHLYNAINDNVVMKSAYIQKSEIGADPPEFIEVAVTLTTTCDK